MAKAITRNVRVSPYKLRIYADAVRGKSLAVACDWLAANAIQRTRMLSKTLNSAYANARQADESITSMAQMTIKEIRVDQGPQIKYFKPGAMGRTSPQTKRMSHIVVVVEKQI